MNIIGAHTDYNDGLVMSAALPLVTDVWVGDNDMNAVRIVSESQAADVQLVPGELPEGVNCFWGRYVVGVLLELGLGARALDILISSNLPSGRGLGSSAALTVATALAVGHHEGHCSKLDLALLCQRVEHKYAGVQCGILDPYTAICAVDNHVLRIDCQALSHTMVTFPRDLGLVVCDSGISRQLVQSQYNSRRAECQTVAKLLGKSSLRTVTASEIEPLKQKYPLITRRAEHVVAENARVHLLAAALQERDYSAIGRIMAAAHVSCRDLYDCSLPAIDFLVTTARTLPGCIGSRLTGAGWGGATVNLVHKEHIANFCSRITTAYSEYPHTLTCFVAPALARGAYYLET